MNTLRDVLTSLLPSPQQSLLLKACLGSRELATVAWSDWVSQVRDPRSVFEKDLDGLKGLLPFVRHALDRNGIQVSEAFRVYLQVSTVREELRSDIYRSILAETLSALRAAGCDVIALRAAALSETVYEEAGIRHNHAIELLVRPCDIPGALGALKQLPYKRQEQPRAWQRHSHSFRHRTGLPLELHTRPLLLPHYPAAPAGIWERSSAVTLSGVATKMLSPPDSLVHVCGHASYSRSRGNLRWVCDSVLTLRRYPDISWADVSECAQQCQLALPISAMFDYLASSLHAPIPKTVLTELSRTAAGTDRLRREAAVVGALFGAASPVNAVRRLRGNTRARLLLVRYFLLPSLTYMRWRYGVDRWWLLPFAYMYRLVKFEALAIVRLVRNRFAGRRGQKRADLPPSQT